MYPPPPMAPPVQNPQTRRRNGVQMNLYGGLLIGAGVILLAFTLNRVGVSNVQTSPGFGAGSVSFTIEATTYMIGLALIGVGVILRTLGAYMLA